MAEAVIGSIAETIVAILVPQALEKVGKLRGVERELEALRDTIFTLKAVLEDAEEQSSQSRQIQVWLEKLKDAFYEAQDVLEEFTIEATRRERGGCDEMMKKVMTFFSSSNQLAFKLKMSDDVRAVRERIEAIKADRGFHLDERPAREWRTREETYSFICEGDITGRDDDKKTIIEFLMDSDGQENVSILPIVGIGGLGKTTLAQLVYNNEMVSKQFNLKMWVYVSNDFDKQKIMKNIIACAKKKESTEVTMEQLQKELRAEIDGKRYLLILDDLWIQEPEKWLSLKALLMGGARGSKILITTRLPSVANITGTAPPYFLGSLSERASFDLLMQMACYKGEKIQDPEMLSIAEEIARKCSGVPLVVRTVGHLLSSKKTKPEWLHFKDYELQNMPQMEDRIISVLRLSYDYLPSHLKQCVAFCSLFPKDYRIKKQTLVDLWIAEGFIQPSNRSQHLEDIAHEYFMDLFWSNFLQEFKKDPDTNEETCKMHDLMHDLASSIARTECWVPWDDTKPIHEKTRHVSVGDLPILRLKASSLRTILSVMPRKRSEADLRQLIQSFKRLRILDMHKTDVQMVPRSICKLKHLTYLDLSNNEQLRRLPNSITRLQNLQTLNLHGCCSLKELPTGIWKLVSLRNLDIDGCLELSYVPRGLGQLSSLHRLTRFILPKEKAPAKNYCKLEELNGLNNIRGSLCVENLGSVIDAVVESKAVNLIGKHSLESLALRWGNFHIDDVVIGDRDEALLDGLRPNSNLHKLTIDGYKGESLPGWMISLCNLVELRLRGCERCKHLPPLGQLLHLKSLDIHGLTELEYIKSDHPFTSTISFPSLLKLNIIDCEKLQGMPLAPHLEMLRLEKANAALINQILGLNKLKILIIHNMKFLEYLPKEGLKSLTSLESLYINNCPRLKSLSLGIRHLSNLVNLTIMHCEELDLSKDESGAILDFQGLQSLRTVDIERLPKLEFLPQWLLQVSNLGSLKISDCFNFKGFLEQIEAFQSLRSLTIRVCPSLTSLSEECLKSLTSLKSLSIFDCPRLTSLPLERHLLNLTFLSISYCEELDLSKEERSNILDFQGLHSLQTVGICDLPKLASLPQWLLQLSNLQDLKIFGCFNLKELPEQIEALKSLQKLEISWCPSLTSLPEGMRMLRSLNRLQIVGCPGLVERCKEDAGEDWYKIAHVPHIYLRR